MHIFARLTGLLLLLVLAGCNLGRSDEPQTATLPTAAPGEPRLVVAWVDAGSLIVWQQGEALPRRVASGGVIQPFIAPDGKTVAFTRGPAGAPDTLWVVDINGTAEQKLVGDGRPARYQEGAQQIGDVVWLDGSVLYFNTLTQGTPAFIPVHDLYRANARTREVVRLLNPGEGGRIHISPDQSQLAVVSAGTYGKQDGRIRVLDLLAQNEPTDLLYFVGVSTGAHYAFYPPIHWLPDNSAILTVIPDKDAIYSDTATAEEAPPVRLWRLPIANPSERELIGSVNASFFGLPRWSDDGAYTLYLQRRSKTNTFDVLLADRNGENPQPFTNGEAGEIEQPRWIPGTTQFVFAQGNAGQVYLGSLDTAAALLSEEVVFAPQFVSTTQYVFATTAAVAADGIQMRYATIGQASQFIGAAGARIPLFDARLVQ
jgi:Tol biopolymer transport system component